VIPQGAEHSFEISCRNGWKSTSVRGNGGMVDDAQPRRGCSRTRDRSVTSYGLATPRRWFGAARGRKVYTDGRLHSEEDVRSVPLLTKRDFSPVSLRRPHNSGP
jgi:hypothetical protein